jgi:hypothetical protein
MVQQQPDEFLAGVTGRADDGGSLCIHSVFLFNAKTQKHREKNCIALEFTLQRITLTS